MKKFVWGFLVVTSLVMFGCGDNDLSVPAGAKAGWTESTVASYMETCPKAYATLSKIIDMRKSCRCVIEEIAPQVTYTEFRSGSGLNGLRASVTRECHLRNRI